MIIIINRKEAVCIIPNYVIESFISCLMLVLWVFAKNLRLTCRLIDDSL